MADLNAGSPATPANPTQITTIKTALGIPNVTDAAVAAKYTKPVAGIPETDLDSATQTKLNAAPTASQVSAAIQSFTEAQALNTPWTFGAGFLDVHDYGAKGDAIGGHDGTVTTLNTFSCPKKAFTNADIGTVFYIGGQPRTITSVSGTGVGNLASFTPNHWENTTSAVYLFGTDDTTAFRNAIAAAKALQGLDVTENAEATYGMLPMGGVVQMRPNCAYIVGNSQAEFTGGRAAALLIPRRTGLMGAGTSSCAGSSIILRPNSYGHVISNEVPGNTATSFSDFIRLENFSIFGYQDWSPSAQDGVHLEVAISGYAKTDPFNRVRNVAVFNMAGKGFYLSGRGELILDSILGIGNSLNGIHVNGMMDYKVFNSNFYGNWKTGVKVESSGAGHWIGCKSFYNGAFGAAVDTDCANWHLTADQMRNGLTYFTNCEAQESRGSAWIIESGLNIFTNCQALDPGRDGLNGGTLPTIVAGFHLKGVECRQNTFTACYAGPSVAIFNMGNNWGLATDAVYIDGVNGSNAGPQKNRGDIYTFVSTVNSNGTTDPGTNYRATFAAKNGAGISNGKNTTLSIDGVPLT